jgi:hypothetical protein
MDREEINQGVDTYQFKFSNSNLNEGFTVLGYDTFVEPTDRI